MSMCLFIVSLYAVHVSLACQPLDLPPLVDDHRQRDFTEELSQVIVPSYQFTCHGRVTYWSACVEPGGSRDRYEIHFHVWRQTREGCYSLVGANIPSELLDPEGNCVNYEVPPRDQILVRPGDVMGFYVNRFRQRRRRGSSSSGGTLQDSSGGGIQLDSNWRPSVQTLTTSLGLTEGAAVNSELCSVQNGGTLQLLSEGAPVMAADVGECVCVCVCVCTCACEFISRWISQLISSHNRNTTNQYPMKQLSMLSLSHLQIP